MALPPKETYFFFEEPHSDLRGRLAVRGFSKSILLFENLSKLPHTANVQRFTIIDASRPDRFHREEELIGTHFILFFDCTEENLQHAIIFFKPQQALAFRNEEACLEYLYLEIAQAVYGAVIDFDSEEVLKLLGGYIEGSNLAPKIINCCDVTKFDTSPNDATFLFANVVNSPEIAHKLLTTTISETMAKRADKCSVALIVTDHRKSYQKVFWSE